MLFPFGIRNRVAILTIGVTIAAFLSSANSFCYSNSLSSARLSTSKGKDKIDEYFAMQCKIGNCVNNNDTAVLITMNENSTKFVHVLDNETTAWHMGGSSNQRAERRDEDGQVIRKFKNHKQQWMKETSFEWPSKCSIEDCTNVPTVGAHVVIDGKENVHLVPLCSRCNSNLSKNWNPNIKEIGEIQSSNGFKLETGTPCLELNHISREECLVSYDPISWVEMYARLVLHIEKYNTTTISNRYKDLGEWATYQRSRYKKRTISSEEIYLLEDIRFSWDPDGDSWNMKFALLKQYQEENGSCNVPPQYEEYGVKLGKWLIRQRNYKRNNKLTVEKEKQLEDLGVIWEPRIDKWEENFKLLQQYKLKNDGDCNVPYHYEENGINLGWWLTTQRQEKKKDTMGAKREKLLEDLGVIWEPLFDQWEENFKLLQQYNHKNGNCDVPKQYEEYGANLGIWLHTQRQEKKKNRLDAEKEKHLEDLGVAWEPLIDQWEKNFKCLQQYKHKNGNCSVSHQYEENGVKLGSWLVTQRNYKRNNKLNDEKEKRLDNLGIIWEPFIDKWEEKYELLEQFKDEKGHCNVPQRQKENEKYRTLGIWLSDQRSYYRKGNLRTERQLKLDKLGVEWNLKRKRKE